MKKLFLLALLVVGVVGFFYASSEGYLGGLSGSGDDKREIRDKTIRFFECLKFKEFKEASAFHNEEDQEAADIPSMIEDLFQVPPEYLDIQDIALMYVEIDSSGILAKSKTRCHAKELNTGQEKDHEVILYWKKEADQWFLKLRSSLERY
jgi:hypothetical protein